MSSLELIAEVGSNHNGDVETACALVDAAVESGATSVKFQFIFAEGLYVPVFLDGQQRVPNRAFKQRLREELTEAHWERIWRHAQARGIIASASVFCPSGINLLRRLGAPYVKIASTDLTNYGLITSACESFGRVILSTGMATIEEVERTLACLSKTHRQQITLLHCVSAYPCPLAEANTQRICLLKAVSGLDVGFSDHTEGVEAAMMSLVQGARVFEKHFTLGKEQPGFDHQHALDPSELRLYFDSITAGWRSLQQAPSDLSPLELVTRVRARRGRYAARNIRAGEVVSRGDMMYVRPWNAAGALDESAFLDRVAARDIPQYASIHLEQHGVETGVEEWRDAADYWSTEMRSKGI